VPFWRGVGVTVKTVEPGRLLVLGGSLQPGGEQEGVPTDGTWTFVLEEPVPGPRA